MAETLSGGCACGAIRFECQAAPVLAVNCHCRDCQRASGTAFSAILAVPKLELQLAGEPRYHKTVGKNGKASERGFCQTCGSQLTFKWERFPDIVGLQAGCLDDPSLYKPMMDVFTASAQPWDHMDPNLQRHAGAPPL